MKEQKVEFGLSDPRRFGVNAMLSDPRRFGVNASYKTYEQSEWVCYMFGGGGVNGFVWRPAKGKHPNWFWRKMQYLLFGNRWVKEGGNDI